MQSLGQCIKRGLFVRAQSGFRPAALPFSQGKAAPSPTSRITNALITLLIWALGIVVTILFGIWIGNRAA